MCLWMVDGGLWIGSWVVMALPCQLEAVVLKQSSVNNPLSTINNLHVPDAFPGDRLRVRGVVEHLDRHPAVVVDVAQRLEDRHEVGGAEAGTAAVGVVGVEMVQELDGWRRITSGVGIASCRIALTSRCSLTNGWRVCVSGSTPSAAVLMKSALGGDSGSRQRYTPRSAEGGGVLGEACRGRIRWPARAWHPCRDVRCSRRAEARGWSPPRSAAARASSARYSPVRLRTAGSAEVRWKPSVFASSQCRPMMLHAVRPPPGGGVPFAGEGVTSVIRGARVNGAISSPRVAQLRDPTADAGVVPALKRLVADGVFHGRSHGSVSSRRPSPQSRRVSFTVAWPLAAA